MHIKDDFPPVFAVFAHHTSRAAAICSSLSSVKAIKPPNIVRRCGCSLVTNSVTTPKLHPPPRIPQNKSGFSDSFAVRMDPSPTTTVACYGCEVISKLLGSEYAPEQDCLSQDHAGH